MGGKFHPKLNICGRPIANKYREGKMKRTLKRESKVLEIAEIEGMASSIGSGIDSDEGSVAVGLQLALGLCGSVAGRSRVRPVLGPRSGWILGGLEEPWEGGCRFGGRSYRPRPDGLPGIEVRKVTPFGAGGAGEWRGGTGGMQCLASVAVVQTSVRSLVAFWDPDEMVVIHPS